MPIFHKLPAINFILTLTPLISLAALAAESATVAGWRQNWTGNFPQARPPLEWSTEHNVLWKTEMPAFSNATSVLTGEKLLVCAEPASLICVDRNRGEILWQAANTYADLVPGPEQAAVREAMATAAKHGQQLDNLARELKKIQGQLKKEPESSDLTAQAAELEGQIAVVQEQFNRVAEYALPATHGVNGYTSATPVTDGRHVWVVFGNGVVACYDLDGTRVWARLVEKPKHGWGHSASPVLAGNKLIVHLHTVQALDATTGAELWNTNLPPHWGALVLARCDSETVVVTPGGALIAADTGQVLANKLAELTYCAPLVADGIAYFVQHGGKAIKLSTAPASNTSGDSSPAQSTETLWETKPPNDRYYASPVVHEGLIYAITQKQVFSVIDASTGEVLRSDPLQLGGTAYPSITCAGGRLYVSSDSGNTVVLKPGRDWEKLAENKLEPFRSTPVFDGTRIYIRGLKHLYCLGEQ